MLYVFIGCLAFGVFYSLVSFLLGGHGDHDAGVDHGADIGHDIGAGHGVDIGHDIGAGHGVDIDVDIGAGNGLDISHDIGAGHGADIGHDIDAGHGAAGVDADHDGTHHASHGDDNDSPSPFNPLVIASAITAFGAAGLISMTGFGLNSLMSTIVALGFSGAIGAALFYGVVKFMYGSQSNSVFSLDALIGLEAEVITPLPEKGLGEIAYKAHGMRSTITARSLDGTEIRRGADVIIREISGNVAVVQRKLTLDDIILDDVTEDSQEDWRNREAKGPGDAGEAEGSWDEGEAEGSWDEGEAEGSWDAGNEESFGNAGDTMGSWDAGDIEEADNGKPRRNAGNINN